jgi:hypothetical protein
MSAEPELVEKVARALCARHGSEIFGAEAITPEFVSERWIFFANDAREVIAIVRFNDNADTAAAADIPAAGTPEPAAPNSNPSARSADG